TALVPRGGGTSLDGESVPPDGAVVVDLSGWSRLLEVDPDGSWARVEPGVVDDLHDRRERGNERFRPSVVPLRSDPRVGPRGRSSPRHGRAGPSGLPGRETFGRSGPAPALHRERGDPRYRDRGHRPTGAVTRSSKRGGGSPSSKVSARPPRGPPFPNTGKRTF